MSRRYAVVGAGVAGVVAGFELRRAGCDVVVFECSGEVGGRTRTIRFADDHLLDAGAAWLTSFYRRAMGYAAGMPMLARDVSGTPRLRLMDRPGRPVTPAPFGPVAVARSSLLTPVEKTRLVTWALGNAARGAHVGPRRGERQRNDDVDAATYARAHLGEGVLQRLLRPAFETMVFAPVDELSAAFVGNWAGAALTAGYRVPSHGMDAPWRRLASRLDVRLHHEVVAVDVAAPQGPRDHVGVRFTADAQRAGSRTSHEQADGTQEERFDGVVVAVPAPVAARMVSSACPGRPAWLPDVRYARHIFAYGARPTPPGRRGPVSDIHPAGPGEHRIGSVQLMRGGDGRVPPGWQAAMVSATGPWSEHLLSHGEAALFDELWPDGMALEPALFRAEDCEVRQVVRWFDGVPIFAPGHLTRLAAWRPSAPVALAGDWSVYPCVEGAVISGQRAAAALLAAG